MKSLKEKVNQALEKIRINEQEIIANDISERAITHKLAEYLQIEFPNYNVDCEYNRNYDFGQDKPKYLKRISDDTYKKFKTINCPNDLSKLSEQVSNYPDIIVHKRMSNKHNILIIEVKKNNNRSDWENDKRKLKGFTSVTNYDKYGFNFGIHITFYVQKSWKKPQLVWYKNGEEINANERENNSIVEER